MLDTEQRFVFLGSQKGLFKEPLPPHVFVCHDRCRGGSGRGPAREARNVDFVQPQFTDILLEKAVDCPRGPAWSASDYADAPRAESISALLGLFHPVVGLVEGFQWLPKEELVEVITRDDASDRFIGGNVDPKAKTLTLLRGDMERWWLRSRCSKKSGDGTAPDFVRLRLTDYGRTVALDDYEASADAILYELDPDYRRRLKKQRRQSERTFGASLMRLRKQRRLKRSEFAPISAKEIARIEPQ